MAHKAKKADKPAKDRLAKNKSAKDKKAKARELPAEAVLLIVTFAALAPLIQAIAQASRAAPDHHDAAIRGSAEQDRLALAQIAAAANALLR